MASSTVPRSCAAPFWRSAPAGCRPGSAGPRRPTRRPRRCRGGTRGGCLGLGGGVADGGAAMGQGRTAERIGLAAVWIGERYDTKDLPSLAGAIGQETSRVRIGAAVTSPGLRHPMVLASMGQTLQSLTGGRFRLGLGRSAEWRWRMYGVPAPTPSSLAGPADILRRVVGGETVTYSRPPRAS